MKMEYKNSNENLTFSLNYLYLDPEFDEPVALLFAALDGGSHLHQNIGVADDFFFLSPEVCHKGVASAHDGLEVTVRRRRLRGCGYGHKHHSILFAF